MHESTHNAAFVKSSVWHL